MWADTKRNLIFERKLTMARKQNAKSQAKVKSSGKKSAAQNVEKRPKR
jgi:hypothetical protein